MKLKLLPGDGEDGWHATKAPIRAWPGLIVLRTALIPLSVLLSGVVVASDCEWQHAMSPLYLNIKDFIASSLFIFLWHGSISNLISFFFCMCKLSFLFQPNVSFLSEDQSFKHALMFALARALYRQRHGSAFSAHETCILQRWRKGSVCSHPYVSAVITNRVFFWEMAENCQKGKGSDLMFFLRWQEQFNCHVK